MKKISVLILVAILAITSCNQKEIKSESNMESFKLEKGRFVHGLSITYTWGKGDFEGAKYKIDYKADGTVSWKGLEGWEKGKSNTENNYYARKIANGIYTVSMLEESLWTVTLIFNTKTKKIYGCASNEKEIYKPEGVIALIE